MKLKVKYSKEIPYLLGSVKIKNVDISGEVFYEVESKESFKTYHSHWECAFAYARTLQD